jgi:hypothetical protein
MAQPLRTAPGGSASMSFETWSDPFLVEDLLSTDERLPRDTNAYGTGYALARFGAAPTLHLGIGISARGQDPNLRISNYR